MFRTLLVTFALLLAGLTASLAVQPDEILADPKLEMRARELSRELRCMVCQNQSIDDSDAPLARDLRVLVRERLKTGESNQQVLDFITSRYGDFVLLKPRFGARTWLLWIFPFAVFGLGAGYLAVRAARRPAPDPGRSVAELAPAEQEKLRRLLDDEPGRSV